MAKDRGNPWKLPANRGSGQLQGWQARNPKHVRLYVAAAALLGVGLGLLLTIGGGESTGTQPPGVPTLPVERPDTSRLLRDFSIEPVQVPESADPRLPPEAQATSIAFGFCAGRSGSDCVIDGDTFKMGAETVRLGLIDAPELGNPACEAERDLAQQAEKRLHALLNSGSVSLQTVDESDRDGFGRLLRDASVNGRSVSAVLIAEGLARPWQGQKEAWC
ncbi:MAG: thermonuclease family protein [Sandaracinobacteroides sp.]